MFKREKYNCCNHMHSKIGGNRKKKNIYFVLRQEVHLFMRADLIIKIIFFFFRFKLNYNFSII